MNDYFKAIVRVADKEYAYGINGELYTQDEDGVFGPCEAMTLQEFFDYCMDRQYEAKK